MGIGIGQQISGLLGVSPTINMAASFQPLLQRMETSAGAIQPAYLDLQSAQALLQHHRQALQGAQQALQSAQAESAGAREHIQQHSPMLLMTTVGGPVAAACVLHSGACAAAAAPWGLGVQDAGSYRRLLLL
jgi:uncharacterized protein (DUF305 family)